MQLLKDHLLSRLLGLDYDGDERSFTAQQRNAIQLTNIDTVVQSKVFRVNCTAYDICWDHDTIRIACGDIVMVALRDDEHPFWYARVLPPQDFLPSRRHDMFGADDGSPMGSLARCRSGPQMGIQGGLTSQSRLCP